MHKGIYLYFKLAYACKFVYVLLYTAIYTHIYSI